MSAFVSYLKEEHQDGKRHKWEKERGNLSLEKNSSQFYNRQENHWFSDIMIEFLVGVMQALGLSLLWRVNRCKLDNYFVNYF